MNINPRNTYPMANKGVSTCPICKKTWLVTPLNDCLLPSYGCYGSDTESSNKNRPCHNCGISHRVNCKVKPMED